MNKIKAKIVISFAAFVFLSMPAAAQELNEKQKENIGKISFSYEMVFEILRDAKKGDRTSQSMVKTYAGHLENNFKEAKALKIPDDTRLLRRIKKH